MIRPTASRTRQNGTAGCSVSLLLARVLDIRGGRAVRVQLSRSIAPLHPPPLCAEHSLSRGSPGAGSWVRRAHADPFCMDCSAVYFLPTFSRIHARGCLAYVHEVCLESSLGSTYAFSFGLSLKMSNDAPQISFPSSNSLQVREIPCSRAAGKHAWKPF